MDVFDTMVNPWKFESDELVSLSSGAAASEKATTDLLQAESIGEEKASEFIGKRLVDCSDDLFSTVKSLKFYTFAATVKQQARKPEKAAKEDRTTFARLLIVSKQCKVDLQAVLACSLSDIPSSLSSADGLSLSKGSKALLLSSIEKHCGNAAVFNGGLEDSVLIIDAMALV